MKENLLKLITYLSALVYIAFWLEKAYVRYYNGNQEIIFIVYTSSGNYDYMDVFQLSELKGKHVYVTLNLRGDWDTYKEDLLAMDALTEKYKDSEIVFLYTVEGNAIKSSIYDWKKVIMKYNLKGYHIKLPDSYEGRLKEDRFDGEKTTTRFPKDMLISDTGEIIDKWAPRPSKKEELTYIIDSLLNNKMTLEHGNHNSGDGSFGVATQRGFLSRWIVTKPTNPSRRY